MPTIRVVNSGQERIDSPHVTYGRPAALLAATPEVYKNYINAGIGVATGKIIEEIDRRNRDYNNTKVAYGIPNPCQTDLVFLI